MTYTPLFSSPHHALHLPGEYQKNSKSSTTNTSPNSPLSHLPRPAKAESSPHGLPLACDHHPRWPPPRGRRWGPLRRRGRTSCPPSRSSRSTDALERRTVVGPGVTPAFPHRKRPKRTKSKRGGCVRQARRARRQEKRETERVPHWATPDKYVSSSFVGGTGGNGRNKGG